MSITFTYRGETSLPVEIEGLTPDWAWDKPPAEIERFEVFHGNQKVPLAELFSVTGDAGDKRFDFEGDLSGVHWIGAQMRSGQVHVGGSVGRHLGSELRGGEIYVDGDASDWIGSEMRGGLIHVRGNAGNQVGAAYRGSAQGMRGGVIVVEGSAGDEVGLLMKAGVIAIGGYSGDMVGFNMMGGTVLIQGNAGIRPGAGMHGGAIAILGTAPTAMLSSFQFNRTAAGEAFTNALQALPRETAQTFEAILSDKVSVYVGDQIEGGTGEIHLRWVNP